MIGATVGVFIIYWPLGAIFKEPIVPAAIVGGGLLGYLVNKKMVDLSASFVWILPSIWLFREILDTAKTFSPSWAGTNLSSYIWDNYFGSQCGGSECLNEVLFSAPCVAAIAYSVTAFFAWLKMRRAT